MSGPMANSGGQTMLDYYVAQGISPVHQNIQDIGAHLDRRQALYQTLGLLPSAFRGRAVLEVGPGSGHNSLFVASLMPERYVLVEGNPKAVAEIAQVYEGFKLPHARPEVVARKFEDFSAPALFDVVLCEGWLGSSEHERKMLSKLATFVADGGALVVTVLSPTGMLLNTVRKALGLRLVGPREAAERRVEIAMAAFSSHLATLASMTRPHRDWLLDMVLSPAYFDICLTPQQAVDALPKSFEFYGSSPRFVQDWRWYKGLGGENRRFSDAFLQSYEENIANFLDYRTLVNGRSREQNRALDAAGLALLQAAAGWERGWHEGSGPVTPPDVEAAMAEVIAAAAGLSDTIEAGLLEAQELMRRPAIGAADVAAMAAFRPLFGRELIYVAFHNRGSRVG